MYSFDVFIKIRWKSQMPTGKVLLVRKGMEVVLVVVVVVVGDHLVAVLEALLVGALTMFVG
jgi:accessory gene regulator protein AgrB